MNSLKFIESFRRGGDIDDYLVESIKDVNTELEYIYGDLRDKSTRLTKDQFLKLKQSFDTDPKFQNLGELSSLDIRCEVKSKNRSVTGNIRATIEGLHQIKQYCVNDLIEPLKVTYVNKEKFKNPKKTSQRYNPIYSDEYPCRVNLKHEIPLDINSREVEVFQTNWPSKQKVFRYKKRFSYLTLDKMWRVDITAIKQTNDYSKTFKQSGLLTRPESFELEIEYVGTQEPTPYSSNPIEEYAESFNQDQYIQEPGSIAANSDNTTVDQTMYDLSINDEESHEPLSPRYDSGIDMGESSEYWLGQESPTWKPEPYTLPDTVTIKEDFWKDSDNEELWKNIKNGYTQNGESKQYIFIPREIIKEPKTTYVNVDISPPPSSEGNILYSMKLLIDTKYINEDIHSYHGLPTTEDDTVSPDSPRGGGLFTNTKLYSSEITNALLLELNEIIDKTFSCIKDTPYYLTKSEINTIGGIYKKMTNQRNSEWRFTGPQPVSMSMEHLNPMNSNSILSKYAVTEKADGVRAQLMIKDGIGYLITPKKEIMDIGLKIEYENSDCEWLFDGEYITQNKRGEPIKLFMIFDVYYSSEYTTQPYLYPWTDKKGISRSGIIRKFKDTVKMYTNPFYPEAAVRVGYKQYYDGSDKLTIKDGVVTNGLSIFKHTKKILSVEESLGGYEYFTDGLIFLPMYLPVKGLSTEDKPKSIGGTWPLNYKWKPPEENTIDFKLFFVKERGRPSIHTYNSVSEDGRKLIKKYQKVKLVVQYKESDDKSIDFNMACLTNRPPNKQRFEYFNPPTHKVDNIHLTNIEITNNKMICLKDKRIITDGSVVEMRYSPRSGNGVKWEPLRIRDDKGGKFQYFNIANNIWNTINEPITTEMIQGNLNLKDYETVVPTSQEYYVETSGSNDKPIRDLHNYIKSKLISRIGSSPSLQGKLMIADLSCGRGGDLKKYLSIQNNIEFILALDISSNINEASQRYYYTSDPKPKALFLQYDTSKSILRREGCLGNSEQCGVLLQMILDRSYSLPNEYNTIQKGYSGIATHGFDIVSSQFSLHYYFKNEETLRGFCENVRDLCSSGGYFIGTCYDGMRVYSAFKQTGLDTLEMKGDYDDIIYQIKKRYDIPIFDYDPEQRDKMYGHEIEVYMASIGQPIVEYLVNFEFFIDMMKEYGFEVATLPDKSREFNPIKESIYPFEAIINQTDDIRENDDKFVKRTNNTSLYSVKNNPGYRQLSSLNNLFIFQKK